VAGVELRQSRNVPKATEPLATAGSVALLKFFRGVNRAVVPLLATALRREIYGQLKIINYAKHRGKGRLLAPAAHLSIRSQ
jgi:hypothetical protein